MDLPVISVCVITYKQAEYISHCLESILGQDVGVPFEVIVGNDCSPDGTAGILDDYARRHAGVVRAFNHPSNLGGKNNLAFVLRQARGRYIAICEGDDFWLDPLKLRKQLAALEADPGASLVFTNAAVARRFGSSWRIAARELRAPDSNSMKEQLYSGWWGIHTATLMFRADLVPAYLEPSYYHPELLSGDWPLVFCAAHHGRVLQLPDVTAAYRHSPGSTMRSGDANRIRLIRERLQWWDVMERTFGASVPMETRRDVARASMRALGYESAGGPKDIPLEPVGFFRRSLRLVALRNARAAAGTLRFLLNSTKLPAGHPGGINAC